MTVSPKNIYNIPTHLCFVDTLASYIMDGYLGGDSDMSDTLVLLPTRRAIQALQDAFVRLSDGKPIILPRLFTLGDVDEDELLFLATELGADYLTDKPAIPPLKRRLVMAKLVQEIHIKDPDNQGKPTPTLSQVLELSDSLCHLLDQIHIEQVDMDKIDDLVPDAFASEHWVKNLQYLQIIKDTYPQYLKTLNLQDGMARRNQLLAKQAQLWQSKSVKGKTGANGQTDSQTARIIIAGSTGSMPATANLMDAVATLPHDAGMVILPGLDMSLSDTDTDAIINDPAHPQYGLIKLLDRLQTPIGAVKTLDNILRGSMDTPTDRYRFLSELMRPASTTHLWDETAPNLCKNALDNITLTECDDSIAEARTIALLMRDVAEQNQQSSLKKTCTLITPDRNLSRQVLAILKRWGIDADDSAGVPLDNTKQGIFLRLMLWVVRDDFAPVALLSLLKHPLMAGGKQRHEMRQLSRALEYAILRGVRPRGGLNGLKTALNDLALSKDPFNDHKKLYAKDGYQVLDILQPLDDFATVLRGDDMGGDAMTLAQVIQHHITIAEKLCTSPDASGDSVLWSGYGGDGLSTLLSNVMEQGAETIINPAVDYESILQTFMAGTVTRTHGVRHPRLKILGAIEARMIKSDVVILGGLNEGTWPPTIESDHWLSRPMRQNLGLPPLERHISLSAHDFVQAFSAEAVHLTRAKKVNLQPTIPSRWLDRMDAVIQLSPNLQPCPPLPHVHWQQHLDDVDDMVSIIPPAPVVTGDARIEKLSSSDLEKLFTNPYGVYAKKILKLYPLDDPEQEISVADVGNVMHNALEDYLSQYPDKLPPDGLEALNALLARRLAPYEGDATFMVHWQPRYERMAKWFVEQEKSDRPHIAYSYCELEGQYPMPLSSGRTMTLTARADRVDKMADGTYRVIDYKTGKTAGVKQLRSGEKPQLLLASKILMDGTAFCGVHTVANAPVSDAQYWQIKGQNNDNIQSVPQMTKSNKSSLTLMQELQNRIDHFTSQSTAVLSHFDNGGAYTVCPTGKNPDYNHYEHLSRMREWSVIGDNDDGGFDND